MLTDIWNLMRKEAVLEWRQKYALGGVFLYVISTVFLIYISFVKVSPPVWNVLFWIVSLFASVNALVKSFVQENGNRQLYYYTLANPTAVILSKIFYNIALLLFINLLSWMAFATFAGNPVKDPLQFLSVIIMGSISLAIAFTFISAIAAKANNSSTLMAILSFPIIIPILITLVKLSANALRLIQDTAVGQDMIILCAIDAILITLCFVLFPFLY
jgi:heme exporter protein B